MKTEPLLEQEMKHAELRKVDAEIARLIAETAKLSAETSRLNAEISKVNAEAGKINKENFWYPMLIVTGLFAAVGGILAVISKFL